MTLAYRLMTLAFSMLALIITFAPSATAFDSRLKDIVSVEGIRENHLIGYGLVVGLNGTGDTLRNIPFARQSLAAMLEHEGVNISGVEMKTLNTAAVMVTATLPPFARQGTRIDINVSSIGDADDLRGGNLLVTSLKGANGEVYAVAQGPISVGGFNVQGEAAKITQGIPTSGRIANGAIIENEIPFELADMQMIKLSLRNPDISTSLLIANAINAHFKQPIARSLDPSTVQLVRPVAYKLPLMNMLSQIEALTVQPQTRAKVVIDERTGIIVIGKDVKVSTVAIAQGNLTISISESADVSQPGGFSDGATIVTPQTDLGVEDAETVALKILPTNVSLQELVAGITLLGEDVGPRDMISILQALKTAGALQADIEVM